MVVLDSCVVIRLIEDGGFASKLRNALRGKPARLVLCDVVLSEVWRVRRIAADRAESAVSARLGKKVERSSVADGQKPLAESVTARYQFCHRGDNLILAMCMQRGFVLLTSDRMLLRACEFVGITAFRPGTAGGI